LICCDDHFFLLDSCEELGGWSLEVCKGGNSIKPCDVFRTGDGARRATESQHHFKGLTGNRVSVDAVLVLAGVVDSFIVVTGINSEVVLEPDEVASLDVVRLEEIETEVAVVGWDVVKTG
jgi:hypothetical protein